MNKEIKGKWIAALKSGKYKQAIGGLKSDNGYCCLGVLCDIVNPEGWARDDLEYNAGDNYHKMYGKADFIPEEIAAELEMDVNPEVKVENPAYDSELDDESDKYIHIELSSLNDDEVPFEKIADLIEEQL